MSKDFEEFRQRAFNEIHLLWLEALRIYGGLAPIVRALGEAAMAVRDAKESTSDGRQ